MAIKTTIRITKGRLSYTLWTLDGVTYGPTNNSVPNWGMTAPADDFARFVNNNPGQPSDQLGLTMRGGAIITCKWLAAPPRFFQWSLNRTPIVSNGPGVSVILPFEYFDALEAVSDFPDPDVDPGPSRIEIKHEYYSRESDPISMG